jgi:hypothetical protein
MKNLFKDSSNHIYCGFVLILSLCLLIACDSDDAPSQESLLPPITMTGENTFGCLIDGKFFRPRDGNSTINGRNPGLILRTSSVNSIEIDARDSKSSKISRVFFNIKDIDIHLTGVYQINTSNGLTGTSGNDTNYMHCLIWNDEVQQYRQYRSYENSGVVNITKLERDVGNYFYHSGTFNGKLINSQNVNDTINISLGRFDIDSQTILQARFD